MHLVIPILHGIRSLRYQSRIFPNCMYFVICVYLLKFLDISLFLFLVCSIHSYMIHWLSGRKKHERKDLAKQLTKWLIFILIYICLRNIILLYFIRVFCSSVLFECFVRVFCSSVLFECFVRVFCSSVLFECFVRVFCSSVLFECFVRVFCSSVLFECFVRVFCSSVL